MGSQASFAEEQPFPAEGMGFAFDNAEVSSVEMSELSGVEMDETEGARFRPPNPYNLAGAATGGGTAAATYTFTSPNPTWGGYITSLGTGAAAGYVSPSTSLSTGFAAGAANASADSMNSSLGGGNIR